ncbi:predicted flavoprotein [alpha proteobacterium BAL199]|nr:predicted flavoprotein [alpha proteobacterium BAL199]
MSPTIDITLIYGSVREERLCDIVAAWAAAQIETHGGFALDVIDPADAEIAKAIAGDPVARSALLARLDRAQAFVVVTPEYNHSFPAALKALIDAAKAEWQAKPVAFVSYGGASGGIRAVEHLRNVFTELHAVGLRDGVAFANAWNQFDGVGTLRDPAGAVHAFKLMLARLSWWTDALQKGRDAQPYSEAVA